MVRSADPEFGITSRQRNSDERRNLGRVDRLCHARLWGPNPARVMHPIDVVALPIEVWQESSTPIDVQ
jgi:hypothetical protein